MMPNGFGLEGGNSSSQSALIIKQPGGLLYYIFTTTEHQNPLYKMSYSIVDMSLNGGNGDVTIKNALMFNPSAEKLTAVNHANGTDIWIIGHEMGTNNFRAYLLTPAGVSAVPVISSVGGVNGPYSSEAIGCLKASPDGRRLATVVDWGGFLELYDFNDTTGVVSNGIQLIDFTGFGVLPYGVEFSPNSQLLYFTYSIPNMLVQYDVTAGSPSAIIASCDTIFIIPFAGELCTLQNGPDGRMYVSWLGKDSLSCITHPNLQGAACNFIPGYIYLPNAFCTYGLPNYVSSYFKNLNTGIQQQPIHPHILSVFPVPASTSLQVSLNTANSSNLSFKIINALGACVYHKDVSITNSQNSITIPLTGFSKGVYMLQVNVDDGMETRKFMVE